MRDPRPRALCAALLLLCSLQGTATAAGTLPAPTATAAGTTSGVDVPSCTPTPADAAFLVLPVGDGRGFTVNRCLARQSAGPRQVQLFLNGAMPGPPSRNWPGGPCAGVRSAPCAEMYGAALGRHALATVAVSGAQLLPRVWWLDIEEENTYLGPPRVNLASIRGTMTALQRRPDLVSRVGIYSSRQQWLDITGGDQSLSVPQWVATPLASLTNATRTCASGAFTSGPVVMVQYQRTDKVDGDLLCAAQTTRLSTPSLRLSRCVLSASGTISPWWPGQPVRLVVVNGNGTRVTSHHGFWSATVAQPCGQSLVVRAQTVPPTPLVRSPWVAVRS